MKHNRTWLIIFFVLQSLDVITTYIGLRVGLYEANGIAKSLASSLGEWALYGWKAAALSVFLLTLFLLEKRYPQVWIAVRLSAGVLLLAVSFNVLNLAMEVPQLLV